MNQLVIYVAGPYTAPTVLETLANVEAARNLSQRIWRAGHVAICPHLNTFEFKVGEDPHTTFLVGDFEIISRCDGMVMLPGWKKSYGAVAERIFAKWLGLPVYEASMREALSSEGK